MNRLFGLSYSNDADIVRFFMPAGLLKWSGYYPFGYLASALMPVGIQNTFESAEIFIKFGFTQNKQKLSYIKSTEIKDMGYFKLVIAQFIPSCQSFRLRIIKIITIVTDKFIGNPAAGILYIHTGHSAEDINCLYKSDS